MTKGRRYLVGAVVVAALAAGVIGLAGGFGALGGRDPDAAVTLREYPPGQRPAAPATLAGETLAGDRLDVADLRGDVVVVNVWGSWCAPCRAETDDLEAVYRATRELGVRFVGINILDDRDKADAFVAGRVSYPSIFDPGSGYALGFDDPPAPLGPPATLVLDRAGGVAAAIYRVVGRDELAELVSRIAAEDGGR